MGSRLEPKVPGIIFGANPGLSLAIVLVQHDKLNAVVLGRMKKISY